MDDSGLPKDGKILMSRMSRRAWMKVVGGALIGGGIGVGLYAWQVEPYWVEVVRRDMPVENLPSSLEGKTLVQVSDIHIGDHVDESFLIRWFQEIARWKPDIVAFTGDFLTLREDGSLPIDAMERVLDQFPHGSRATIGILGNHDYGIRWNDPRAAQTVVQIAGHSGINILRNQTIEVAGLQIVGFDDYWGTNFAGRRVFRGVDLERAAVVLCHNPDVADLPIWSGYKGWILSGHTHGGQCKAPWCVPPRLPIQNKRYSSGEIAFDDGRRLYVNRALGHSIPVRLNVRPEITVFTLRASG